MARLLKYVERMLMRFPAGTTERIDAMRGPIEDRADFVRGAVEQELQRREHAAAGKAPAQRPTVSA
jgi:hypothetical protein